MRKKIDLIGMFFGDLRVSGEGGRSSKGVVIWKCVCSCGVTCDVRGDRLRNGETKSCGCLRSISAIANETTHGHTKNKRQSPTYKSWASMLYRCQDPNYAQAEYYSGRGITVCDRWQSFENFLEDMGERPPGLTLDRKNNNGNYEPGNCRWATDSEQSKNRRPRSEWKSSQSLVREIRP